MERIAPSARLEAQIEELLGDELAANSERLAELGRLGARLVLQRAVEDEETGDICKSCGLAGADHAAFRWSSRSMLDPSTKVAPARTSATWWGALTQRQRAWAASSSL